MIDKKITVEDQHKKSQTRIALEYAIQLVDLCETIDELKKVWNQFQALQGTWQFQLKCKMKKNEILTHD